MMGVGGGHDSWGWRPVALTSLTSPLNTTSSALSRSIFSFISSWMASASCAAYGDGDGGGVEELWELQALAPSGQCETVFASLPKGWKTSSQHTQCQCLFC